MTVKELRKKLEQLPDDMDVFMDERLTDFRYGLVNSAEEKEIAFSEDPDGEAWAYQSVMVLSEE